VVFNEFAPWNWKDEAQATSPSEFTMMYDAVEHAINGHVLGVHAASAPAPGIPVSPAPASPAPTDTSLPQAEFVSPPPNAEE
jgi:hypothetical protein